MISYIISRVLSRMAIKSIKNSKIDKTAKLIGKVSVINSSIGKYSYVNNNSSIINTDVGSFCSIAGGTVVGGAAHPTDWLSSSPVFHSGRNPLGKHFSVHKFSPYKKTTIGNDVWIGTRVLIKAGVNIGNGAIIGMGSVVTKDIPDYEIWAGNPAKKIRDRFDDETKKKLLDSKWWEKEDKKIEEMAQYANDLPKLFEEMENSK